MLSLKFFFLASTVIFIGIQECEICNCLFPDFRPAMADISKEQLKKEIQDILKDADLDNTSAKKVE